MLTVTRENAIAIFEGLGFNTAKKWDNTRLQKKLVYLSKGGTEEELEDEKLNSILDDICDADGEVQLEGTEEKASPAAKKKVKASSLATSPMEETTKKKKKVTATPAKKVSTKKKTTKKKTASKKVSSKGKVSGSSAGTDKFGSRIGSKTANINAALSKKPQTMAELMETVGSGTSFYNHMNKLVEQGYVIKTDDGGYKLA